MSKERDDRIFNAIILLDEPGGRHFCTLVRDRIKTIETRMRNIIPAGDIVICNSNGSMTADHGKAVCIVTADEARRMVVEDEKLACIECVPGRWASVLSNWRYFNIKFEFAKHKVKGTYQSVFQIRIPDYVQIIPFTENTISKKEGLIEHGQ